jgi:preprotein translocase subunit SecE
MNLVNFKKLKQSYMMDKIKLVIALLLVGGGIEGFYLLEDHAMVFRTLAVLAGLVLAAAVFGTTVSGKTFYDFSRDSVAEAKRVVWPSRRETIQTTVAVFVLVLIMAIFLWIVDIGFMSLVKVLMGQGS